MPAAMPDDTLLAISVGPLVCTRPQRPSPQHFDITFVGQAQAAGRALGGIIFRNYYCAFITVKQSHPEVPDGAGSWVTVLEKRVLMKDPHHEDDAEDWHTVSVEEFLDTYDPASRAPLRVCLQQPSPVWSKCALRDVQCFAKSPVARNLPASQAAAGAPGLLAAGTGLSGAAPLGQQAPRGADPHPVEQLLVAIASQLEVYKRA